MTFLERYGPWALVTGSGNGLGAEFARQLAARGLNLILVDIDGVGLERVATELRDAHGVEAATLTLDLSRADILAQIDRIAVGKDLGLIVNNAGISGMGLFRDKPLENHLQVVDVNIRAPLMLTHHFLPHFVERGRGGLLFVSSLSALQGTAYVANYAATKAWNLLFAEGLWEELRETGVDVLGYLVGSTRTPGFENSRPQLQRAPMVNVMEMEETVAGALAALGHGPSQAAGRGNRFAAWVMSRLLPRKWAVRIVSGTMRSMYG